MKKTMMVIIAALLMTNAEAQTKATTEDGKVVLLEKNGTWRYDAEKKVEPVAASDCDEYIETINDKVTGESYRASRGFIKVIKSQKEGMWLSLVEGSTTKSIIFSVVVIGGGSCIDKGDYVKILFTDGTRMELRSDAEFNCKGTASVYLGKGWGRKAEMKTLSEKNIATLRVFTNDGYSEQDFTSEQAETFRQTLMCLSK